MQRNQRFLVINLPEGGAKTMPNQILHGVTRPAGDGVLIEVHTDSMAGARDMEWCAEYGFEDDPFSIFHPAAYTHHMTGRARVPQKELGAFLMKIEALTTAIVVEAQARNIRLYTEVEIVRETIEFPQQDRPFVSVLDALDVRESLGQSCGADVHLEWGTGTVSQEVCKHLRDKGFYWVRTPRTAHCPPQDIATLQASSFRGGKDVFDLIAANPFPGITGMHLEQKPSRIGMRGTDLTLPMPGVFDVCWRE